MAGQDPRQVQTHDFPPGLHVSSNAFPGKLWKLVNDDFYQSINWSNNGTSLGIDALKFKHEVLKCVDSVFKTKNFSSFVRQLNLYGFRKITSVHPSSRACEFSNRDIHSHHHQQLNGDLQHFSHNFFNRAHPELLIRVRRASAAQKRKAQENSELRRYPNHPPFPPLGLGLSNFNTPGILRDRTNVNNPCNQPGGRQAPFPVSLHATQGKIFGLSLIASTSRGSLIGAPTSNKFDFNKLCDQNGQLKKYVIIGRQDAFGDEPMLSDSSLLSPKMPILKAYNMSPLGNPKSSVGYALTDGPLDTSISEAESAVSYLLNESFDSSPSSSPQPVSPWQQAPSPDPDDEAPDSPQPVLLSSGASCQSSDNISNNHGSYSDSSSSRLSGASSFHLSGPSSSSSSGTSRNSCFSSDTSAPSLYHTSSSSSLFSSGASFSTSSSADCGSSMMSSFGSSQSNTSMAPPSLASHHGKEMPPPLGLASHPGKEMFPPSSLVSHPDGMLLPSHLGKDISSSFMTAVPDFNPSISHPAMMNPFQFHPEQPMMVEQGILMDCEEQLAAPLPQSPVNFAGGLLHPGHAVCSTPLLGGPPGCSTPNCPCQHGKGHPMFCAPPPPFQLYNVQPFSLDSY